MKLGNKLFTVMTLVFVAQFANGQPKNPINAPKSELPNFVRSINGIKEYALDNGMKLLFIPDATQSNFVVNIVYQVGSRHEGYGETGMAHLLEHMLFKSCKNFTDIKKAIADKGASANGTTWYDRTNYYEIMPASEENLKWAIEMEADRMLNAKILKEELDKEFSVVRNEFEIGENDPGSVLNERILSSMYLWHNYGNSTIGSREDIERVPVENLRSFYIKYYQPDNATLIIAGKFDEKKALQFIAENFSIISKPDRILQPTYTVEPPQDGERYVELRRNGDENIISAAYHTPCMADADYAANAALVEILTSEGSGVLYKAVIESKLATKVYGYQQTLFDPGFTYFSINVPLNQVTTHAENAFFKVMDNLGNIKISAEELNRAKTKMKKDMEAIENRTLDFGVYLTEIIGAGDYRLFFLYKDAVEKLTIEDVKRVAKKYYLKNNKTWGRFIPDRTATDNRIKVSETPNIAALVKDYKGDVEQSVIQEFDATIPNIRKNITYGNAGNLKFALLNKPTKGEKINGIIKFYVGDESSLNGQSYAGSMMAKLLMAGTKTMDRTQIQDALNKIKSDLQISFSENYVFVNISSDKLNIGKALQILNDVLKNPIFDQQEFDKEMLSIKSEYEAIQNDPQALAFFTINNKCEHYPIGHPYYSPTLDEQIKNVQKVTLNDIKSFYKKFVGNSESYATFIGSMDSKGIQSQLNASLGKWKSQIPYKKIAHQYFENNPEIIKHQIDDKSNAVAVGNLNLNISKQHPDFPALFMANELLGGGSFLNSRIPQKLREEEGMSYGAGSFLDCKYDENVGNFGVYAFYNPIYQDRLNIGINDVINNTWKNGFTQKELDDSKASLVQQRKMTLGNNSALAFIINSYMESKRDLSSYDEFSSKISGLSLTKVNDAMKKYIDLKNLFIIYCGDFKPNANNKGYEKNSN